MSDQPRSSFEKRVVSTPRLICNLHTMSQVKATPDVLQDCERKKMALREPLRFHMYQKWRYRATSSCMAFCYARGFSYSREVCPRSDREEREFKVYMQEIFRILCLSRWDWEISNETMVEASTEGSTTLRNQRFLQWESFTPQEASRKSCRWGITRELS